MFLQWDDSNRKETVIYDPPANGTETSHTGVIASSLRATARKLSKIADNFHGLSGGELVIVIILILIFLGVLIVALVLYLKGGGTRARVLQTLALAGQICRWYRGDVDLR